MPLLLVLPLPLRLLLLLLHPPLPRQLLLHLPDARADQGLKKKKKKRKRNKKKKAMTAPSLPDEPPERALRRESKGTATQTTHARKRLLPALAPVNLLLLLSMLL